MERRIKHYSNFHQILLVGEGDFSFSLALANVFESAENLVPTSLDSREKVISSYTWGKMNLENLEKYGAMTLHGVDATKMDKHEILRKRSFDRIVFNFPHAGFGVSEKDDTVIKKHSHLVKMFFKNAKNMLSKTGEIHVNHKVKAPYDQWKVVEQAKKSGLILKESVEFNIADYPGYTNRRGAAPKMGQTFSLGECRTYTFILSSCFHDHMHCDERELMERPNRMPKSLASAESLKAVVLELESERKKRKASETAKVDLEASLNRLKTDADKIVKERDELRRKINNVLHQKDEALREKAAIAKQLEEASRMKEEAIKQRDEILRQPNDLAKQKDEILRLKEEATKARESSRSEIEAAAQTLISRAENITRRVSSIKSFTGGLPRTSKRRGMVAVAYGAMKRTEEIVEELVSQHEIIMKERNDVCEQMEQRNYQIAIEVSQLEATIIESENLQKLILAKDGRISELESEMSEKLDQEGKEYETLKRFADGTQEKLKNLELKIEKQKPIIFDQLVYISKAQECLKNVIQMIDGSASVQLEFSEPLFVSQDLDIDKDLVSSFAGTMFVSELTSMVEKNIMADLEKRNKEKKEFEDDIVSLQAEKRDISTLLRSALGERLVAGTEGDCEKQVHQRKGVILQVAERDVGLNFSDGVLIRDHKHGSANRTENGADGFFSLASALENIIKTSQLEIAELRHSLEAARTEANPLRVVSETETKDLAAEVPQIKELEEKERAASKNVEGLMMDITATEEEISRWRDAAEQEAAAGKSVMEEFEEEITTLRRDFEEMKRSLDETNSKLKSKEEMTASAVAARDIAEKSLQLADERASRLRARIEELTRQLEELDGRDERQNSRQLRYAC